MSKMGRPKKYTKEVIENIRLELEEYTNNTDLPRLCDFCYKHNIRKQRMYEFNNAKEGTNYYNENFSDTFKKMEEKEEAQLWEYGLMNVANATMTIFRLKQKPFNYSDKQEISLEANDEIVPSFKEVLKEKRNETSNK